MKLWIICFVRLSIFCFEQEGWWWWWCRRHALHLLLLIYIYKRTLWIALCFLLWTRSMINDDAMRYDQWWWHALDVLLSSLLGIYLCKFDDNETMDCFMRLSISCSKQVLFVSNLIWLSRLINYARNWFQRGTETPSIVCPKQVLWTGFKFVLLSRLINYASDYNAPQKRLVLKKYVLFYIYIMGAVSLLSAAGVGDGSASSGDLRVSLFSWISSKNFSRKGRSIKEKVTLAVNWRRRPSLPSLSMYTGMQNFPSFSFLCYSLLVDLYLLIVPKLRSAFLDLQFCRRWASNFCCNLSYYYYF